MTCGGKEGDALAMMKRETKASQRRTGITNVQFYLVFIEFHATRIAASHITIVQFYRVSG